MSEVKPSTERFFLISQADVDKIDALVGALNLAITEILEGRPVRDHRSEDTGFQRDYDEEVGEILYRGSLLDHW